MLQSIHDKAKGVLGIIIVAFLALVFGLWGIGDYLTDGSEKFAAKVGDVEISQSEFEQNLARQRQQVEQQNNGKLPDDLAFQQQLKKQTIEQLILQRVLRKKVADDGYRVPDVVLAQKIQAMEAFQQEGAFDNQSYQALVESRGMSVKEFENLYRSDLQIGQIQQGISQSAVIGPVELNIINNILQQSREIVFLQFDDIQYMNKTSVTDEEISDEFENNQARYMTPETVTISYVELTAEDLAENVEVDAEAVQRLYDAYVVNMSKKEQRKTRHILVDKQADADAILLRLKNGESFEEIAKTESKDPGSAAKGGDLGWVSSGMMVAEFESALFKLKKSQVSDVVKSSFGYHIIQVDDIKSVAVASFESKKSELIEQYKAQFVEDGFYEKSELMATTAYESDQSLQEVADAIGAEIKTVAAFSRAKGNGVASYKAVRKAAFNREVLEEGRNSEIIELAKNHALVLRVDTHEVAKPKKLDEVKAIISSALLVDKAKRLSKAAALSALAGLESGADIATVDKSAKLVKVGFVKRDSMTVDAQIVREAFSMAKPAADKVKYKVAETNTGSAVIMLKSVASAEKLNPEQIKLMTSQLQNEQANRDLNMILEHLKSKVKIIKSEEL